MLWWFSLLAASAQDSGSLFGEQVRPLLEKHCQGCHNPAVKQSGLDLTTRDKLLRGGDHGPAVMPGKPSESPLYQYVTHLRKPGMPFQAPKLSGAAIERIAEWITTGAAYDQPLSAASLQPKRASDHWSFQPVRRPALPAGSSRNAIDQFLDLARRGKGLAAMPQADKTTLLRRVTIDLTGLPPSRDELRAFRSDTRPDAYDRAVTRLLASPRHGERWARHWMDIWRYSDWYGSGAREVRNSQRHMWHWRDWIIESLNNDKGYDRMVREMLAGDEIAPADSSTLRATGFLARNWYRFNRNVWLRDTVESVSTAFLGVTLKCARCHDHKYDPFGQEEYYRFRAFFEPHDIRVDRVPGQPDTREAGIPRAYDSKAKEALPDPEEGQINLVPAVFEHTYLFVRGDENSPDKSNPLAPGTPRALGKGVRAAQPIELPVESYFPDIRGFVADDLMGQSRDRLTKAQSNLRQAESDLESARREIGQPVRATAPVIDYDKEIRPLFENRCMQCHSPRANRSGLNLASLARVLAGGLKSGPAAIPGRAADSPLVQYLRGVKQPRMPLNGPPMAESDIRRVEQWIDSLPPKPSEERARDAESRLRIGKLEIATAEESMKALAARLAADQAKYQKPDRFAELAKDARRAEQTAAIARAQENILRARIRLDAKETASAKRALEAAVADLSKPGDEYTPAGIEYPKQSTGRRLALAEWITNRDNPLAARVAVNHIWMRHFGEPLAPNVTDFGRNGKPPIHRDLLDWLAAEFMESGWSMKALHRLIVTSEAYRMQSDAGHAANEKIDPPNLYYWRMNVRRMESEAVRDSALHLAGTLDETIGGKELNEELQAGVPRRSLYFRLTPDTQHEFLRVFDPADPMACYRRTESIMPQQALAMMNSSFLASQSKVLADKLPADESAFLEAAFETILARPAAPGEAIKSREFLRSFPAATGRQYLVQALFNHNEFVVVR